VDPSQIMSRAARRFARRAGFGPSLVHAVGDGARLRFPPDRFDCVFAVTVLLHVRNSETILREMVHVTRTIMDGVVSRMYPDPFSGRTLYGRLVRLGLRDVRLAVEVFQDTKLEPYTHAMLSRRAENAVKLGLAAPRAAARWLAAVERLAAIGQFAFTLNYYAARGVKP